MQTKLYPGADDPLNEAIYLIDDFNSIISN